MNKLWDSQSDNIQIYDQNSLWNWCHIYTFTVFSTSGELLKTQESAYKDFSVSSKTLINKIHKDSFQEKDSSWVFPKVLTKWRGESKWNSALLHLLGLCLTEWKGLFPKKVNIGIKRHFNLNKVMIKLSDSTNHQIIADDPGISWLRHFCQQDCYHHHVKLRSLNGHFTQFKRHPAQQVYLINDLSFDIYSHQM